MSESRLTNQEKRRNMEQDGFERSYQEESWLAPITNMATNNPFKAIGVLGLTTIVGIGAYKWKTRTLPIGLYLIQLRLAAQSTVVVCLSMGMGYHMFKDFVFTKPESKEQ